MIQQTPWFERKFDFNFTVGIFPVIIERLRGTLPQLTAMVQNVPEEKLNIKKDGKWSVKEVIGHLYDLEGLWSGRIDDFLDHKEILRETDLSNRRTTEANHNSRSVSELLKQFSISRKDLIQKTENLTEEAALITSLHPRLKQPMRLIDSLFFVAEHDDHELTKIRGLLMDKTL